jgi:hypothetical protein
MQLDKAVVDQLRHPMWLVWNYIGSDCMVDDNECAIEMCIDADRLTTCAEAPEADKLIGELIKEHGYNKVLKFLSKNFLFV